MMGDALVEVTKSDFYRAIGPENIGPRAERDHSDWEFLNTRQSVGRSEPGYMEPGKPKRYWLRAWFAEAKEIRSRDGGLGYAKIAQDICDAALGDQP